MLLHFVLVLHFAAIVITLCVSITFCGDYYILRRNNEPCPALSKPDHLARATNRVRQSTQPQDPLDLDFELCQEHVPDGFLKADIKKHGNAT